MKQAAEKEGFRVDVERGDSKQGQQYQGVRSGTALGEKQYSHIVDPQKVAMPSTGQPGQVSVAALFKRVAADQLFMAPLGLAIFISTMAVLEGLEWDQVVERYQRLYWPILLINWQMFALSFWTFSRYTKVRFMQMAICANHQFSLSAATLSSTVLGKSRCSLVSLLRIAKAY